MDNSTLRALIRQGINSAEDDTSIDNLVDSIAAALETEFPEAVRQATAVLMEDIKPAPTMGPLQLNRSELDLLLDATWSKISETEHYLRSYPEIDTPRETDTCCDAHRLHFLERQRQRASLQKRLSIAEMVRQKIEAAHAREIAPESNIPDLPQDSCIRAQLKD